MCCNYFRWKKCTGHNIWLNNKPKELKIEKGKRHENKPKHVDVGPTKEKKLIPVMTVGLGRELTNPTTIVYCSAHTNTNRII